MKLFKGYTQGIQGDVAFTRIDALPKGMKLVATEKGDHIVAHSGTGHNHIVAERSAKMYKDPTNPRLSFLVVEDSADLTHLRTYDTHETVQFDKGIYRINRQREYTPEGLRSVAD